MGPSLLQKRWESSGQPQAAPAMPHPSDHVSGAERRVLLQLLQGLNNRAIAAALVLSPRTVESHISHLLAKTGCTSRTQLLLWALAER